MSEFGTRTQLEGCQQTVTVLEKKLEQRSRELSEQVRFNSLVLILGLFLGFVFAKIDRSKLFRKTK